MSILAARREKGLALWHPDDARTYGVAPLPREAQAHGLTPPPQRLTGVSWDRRGWRARVYVRPGERILLGFYREKEDAEAAVLKWRESVSEGHG